MDVLTPEQRRRNMKNIRSKDTSIEIRLRKALWRNGIRFRKNYKKLPGKPDIVITKYKIVVFCDSEFWHGKDWEQLKLRLLKGEKADYWINKIKNNMDRDNATDKLLKIMGWKVIHFWGKDIRMNTDDCVKVIQEAIFSSIIENDTF